MMMTMTVTMITFMLSTAVMYLTIFISKKKKKQWSLSKKINVRVRIWPKKTARLPLSSRFFLITVIFLIFDVEIALLLPMPITMTSSMKSWALISSAFLLILIIGLYHEWNQGSLEWSN